ncbi:hypothetical protein [Xanthobacter autotrophicus]|uniref:hypothetical protein n=1 Tax=Xanthobacter autotrophicus TaxID=280 RepID=UPI003726CE58
MDLSAALSAHGGPHTFGRLASTDANWVKLERRAGSRGSTATDGTHLSRSNHNPLIWWINFSKRMGTIRFG